MSRRRLHRLAFGLTLTLAAAPAPAAELAAVVSAKAAVSPLTAAQLADIYFGRSNRFPDVTPAQPCDLAEGSPLRDEFYNRVTGKSAAQVKAYWSKMIFTGRGRPPREVASSQEAKRLVVENPGVVCYIDRGLVDSSVTVVLDIGDAR